MKRFTAIVTCAAFLASFQIRADEGVSPSEEVEMVADTAPAQPADEEASVKYVSKTQEEKKDNAVWTKFLIAGAAVAVAVIALVCVSKNQGHRAS